MLFPVQWLVGPLKTSGLESKNMGIEHLGYLCRGKLGDRASRRDISRHVHTWLVGRRPFLKQSFLLIQHRQWTYWIAAILTAVMTLAAVFLKESRASKLLETGMRKVAKEHKDM